MSDRLIEHWLASACADAEVRGLPGLKPLLSALADATRTLREVNWYEQLSAPAAGTLPRRQPGDEAHPGDGEPQ
jgi:hypothetical protein